MEILVGSKIRQLRKIEILLKLKLKKVLCSLPKICLGNHKEPNYEQMVKIMVRNFQIVSIKLEYFRNHPNIFSANLGNYVEES